MDKHVHKKDSLVRKKRIKECSILTTIVLLFLIIGTLLFKAIESWDTLTALYFTTTALTTVGFGDITPATSLGKIIAIVYAWIGVTIVASAIGIIGSIILHERIHKSIHEKIEDLSV